MRPAAQRRSFARAATGAMLIAAFGFVAGSALHATARADEACDLYADPAGNDANDGLTPQTALQSPITLLARLDAGQDGCLKDGANFVLGGGEAITSAAGNAGSPKILRPATPGARATITSTTGFWVRPAAHDLVLRDLDIRRKTGKGSGSLFMVDGDRITLDGLDLTYPSNICLDVGGDPRAGDVDAAEDFVLQRSRVHDCGSDYGPPHFQNDSGVHGIYMQFIRDGADADGYGAIVEDNLVYRNHNRGIQLYPDTDDALIQYNVLYANGANLNLGSEGAIASQRNLVTNNIVSDSRLDAYLDDGFVGDTAEVHGNYAIGVDTGNHVDGNCVSNSANPDKLYDGRGFTHADNIENQDPQYADAANGDFTLAPQSPCAGKGPRPANGVPTCHGMAATVEGVIGTSADDVIVGTAGDDVISGRGGNDTICGGDGFDTISGGPGSDLLDGEGGGDGADYADAPTGVTVDLALQGTAQATGEGTDTLISFTEVYGSAHDDRLLGTGTNRHRFELLYGAGGSDTLNGRGGDDTVSGGPGGDSVVGGKGADALSGGGGRDKLDGRDGAADASLDCGAGTDRLSADATDPASTGCETVTT